MFSPGQVIFSKLFYCSGRRQQKLSKKVVFLGFQKRQNLQKLSKNVVFSRISEATLGSFSAPFRGFFVLHCHGVWGWRIPCFGGLEGGSFELISSLICYRISEATLGSFSAPFRGFVVLHCHGVWGWRIPCFDCDGVWLLVWVMILKKNSSNRRPIDVGILTSIGYQCTFKKNTVVWWKIKDL